MININKSIIISLFSFSFIFNLFNSASTITLEGDKLENTQPWHCDHNGQERNSNCQIEEEKGSVCNNIMNYSTANPIVKFNIPIVAHRFQDRCMLTTTATEAEIIAEINATNQTYEDLNFHVNLVLIDIYEHVSDSANTGVPIICPSDGYVGTGSWDQDFMDRYEIAGAINLFFVQGERWQHAYLPEAQYGNLRNHVIIKYFNNGWSTLHELGHTFNLEHTFESGGDHVSDTDVTINLEFMEDATLLTKTDPNCNTNDCNCSWDWTDPNETLPLHEGVWNNIMNYGVRECSRIFTPGQIGRMWDGIFTKISFGDFDFCLLPPAQRFCENMLTLSGTVEGQQMVNTKEYIYSNQEFINSGQHSRYTSKRVILTPGFVANAENGAKLKVGTNPIFCNCPN